MTHRFLPLILSFAVAVVSLGSRSTASAQTAPGLYELRSYVSEPGRQAEVLKLIQNDGVPFMKKHNLTLVGAWTPVNKSDERVFTLLSHKDKASCDAAWAALQNDDAWKAALQKSVVDGKRPVKSFERIFLTPNDYSPAIDVKSVGNRVFELRSYIASEGRLDALNARFRNHTLKLFEKHGMTNIAYWSVRTGEELPAFKLLEAVSPIGGATAEIKSDLPATGNSLVYFITHASPEAAQESFKKFGGDEAWVKARKESEAAAGGSLTVDKGVKSLFLTPTDFSPLK
jgi:hypothetical protein